jgi:hypothetical protein
MNKKHSYLPVLLVMVLILSSVLTGCSSKPQTQVAAAATEAPSSTPVPSDTPVPTSTNTPVPTDTPTAVPTATRTATPNRTATQAVKLTATQAANEVMVGKELAKYNIDPSLGHVAWVMDDPVELDGSGYAQGFFRPIKELGVVKDFVMQSDVIWTTSGALAGCAYIFRGPEDWDVEIGDFYELATFRMAGAPTWLIDYYEAGRWKYSLPGGRGVQSANLEDDKMAKNVLTIDARGDTFTVYINGVKERAIENNKIAEGRIAFEVIQNSGSSYCKFSNAWVWVYDKLPEEK